MNACSSAVSLGACADRSLFQSGRPVNSSPSHHTVPASSASRSVSDIVGSMRRYVFRNGLVMKRSRKASTLSSAMAPNTSHNVASHGVAGARVTEYVTRAMPAASVAARRDTRW